MFGRLIHITEDTKTTVTTDWCSTEEENFKYEERVGSEGAS